MTSSEKYHNTGLRILEVLKILLERDVSKNEIISILKEKENIENVYTQEAFIKYFNTLKIMGLKFTKDKTKYHLNNAIFKTDFTIEEIRLLIYIIKNSLKLNSSNSEQILENLFFKLDKYIDYNIYDTFNKIREYEQNINNKHMKNSLVHTLEKFLEDNLKIEITYEKSPKIKETIITELKEISENKNNPYIICYNPQLGRNKKIYINSIISVNQLPNKSSGRNYLNSVIFEIYGRLAVNYKLKESENIINFSNNHITVSNTKEDKDSLFLRLLKYGEYCKIIRPQYMQEEFIALTNNILKNLEAV